MIGANVIYQKLILSMTNRLHVIQRDINSTSPIPSEWESIHKNLYGTALTLPQGLLAQALVYWL